MPCTVTGQPDKSLIEKLNTPDLDSWLQKTGANVLLETMEALPQTNTRAARNETRHQAEGCHIRGLKSERTLETVTYTGNTNRHDESVARRTGAGFNLFLPQ